MRISRKLGLYAGIDSVPKLFFDNGDQCTKVTGGWTKEGYSDGHDFGNTAQIAGGELRCVTTSNYHSAILGTTNPIDLTKIDKLYFQITSCQHESYSVVGVTKTKNGCDCTIVKPSVNGANAEPSKTGASIVTLDVSSLSGEYYIYVMSWKYDYYNSRTYVSKIWAGVDPAGTVRSLAKSIAIGNTYRYANSLIAGDWVKVSSLSFGSINYVGQGTEDYNAMMVPVSAFTYTGTFQKVKLALYLWTSDKSNHTFRWAVTTSTANANAYKVGAGAVTDSNQLAQGTFTPPYSDAYQWFTFELTGCTVASGTPIYIYLWRDNTTYGNIHVMESAVVTLEYAKN